jgi:hypothetical protein
LSAFPYRRLCPWESSLAAWRCSAGISECARHILKFAHNADIFLSLTEYAALLAPLARVAWTAKTVCFKVACLRRRWRRCGWWGRDSGRDHCRKTALRGCFRVIQVFQDSNGSKTELVSHFVWDRRRIECPDDNQDKAPLRGTFRLHGGTTTKNLKSSHLNLGMAFRDGSGHSGVQVKTPDINTCYSCLNTRSYPLLMPANNPYKYPNSSCALESMLKCYNLLKSPFPALRNP